MAKAQAKYKFPVGAIVKRKTGPCFLLAKTDQPMGEDGAWKLDRKLEDNVYWNEDDLIAVRTATDLDVEAIRYISVETIEVEDHPILGDTEYNVYKTSDRKEFQSFVEAYEHQKQVVLIQIYDDMMGGQLEGNGGMCQTVKGKNLVEWVLDNQEWINNVLSTAKKENTDV